jgi:hypothetical protein
MIYTHVLNRGPGAVRSPADALAMSRGSRVGIEGPRPGASYAAAPRRLSPPDLDDPLGEIVEWASKVVRLREEKGRR